MTPTVTGFSDSFVTQYQEAFEYMLGLGHEAGERVVGGKETYNLSAKGQKVLYVLEALDCSDLTDKEVEALEFCLLQQNEDRVIPTVEPVYLVPTRVVENQFLIGDGDDIDDYWGDGDDVEGFIPEITIETEA